MSAFVLLMLSMTSEPPLEIRASSETLFAFWANLESFPVAELFTGPSVVIFCPIEPMTFIRLPP